MCLDEETTLVAPFLGKGDPLLFFCRCCYVYMSVCVHGFCLFYLGHSKTVFKKKKKPLTSCEWGTVLVL